jgi:L-ascorbate metabolism protein UlaG (beta-lactamase superfamily)
MTNVRLTHIGGPTTLIEVDGWRLLTDPTFDHPGEKYNFRWGTSSRKVTGPAIAASGIGPIDAVLLTHDHHAATERHVGPRLLRRSVCVREGAQVRAHAPLHDDRNELSDSSAVESLVLGFDGRPHVALSLRLFKLVNDPHRDRPDIA